MDPGNLAYRKSLDALSEKRQNLLVRLLRSNVPAMLVIVLLFAVVFNMIASKNEANYDNLSSRLDSIQQGIVNTRKQESKSVKQLEEKYQEVYRLREEAFLITESEYAHQIENLHGKIKELESELEVINADALK